MRDTAESKLTNEPKVAIPTDRLWDLVKNVKWDTLMHLSQDSAGMDALDQLLFDIIDKGPDA